MPISLICFGIFFLGLAVGSFLNCVIYRLEKEESFLKGRSFCPHCQHILSWQDLIPLLGFLVLRGKCRYCQKPISFQYPLVEIVTAVIFLLIFIFFTSLGDFISNRVGFLIFNFLNLIYYWIISCFLIIIFVYDLKHYIIPDKVIYPAIVIAGIFNFLPPQNFSGGFNQFSILSAFGAAGFFGVIVLISRGKWMGVGDIKLAFLMGLFLGWPNILMALFSAFLIGAIIGIGLMALGKKTLKSEVPFGPFLVTGTFLALFWGQEIVNFYVQTFYFNAF